MLNKWRQLERFISDYHRAYLKETGKENNDALFILDKMAELDKQEREEWISR